MCLIIWKWIFIKEDDKLGCPPILTMVTTRTMSIITCMFWIPRYRAYLQLLTSLLGPRRTAQVISITSLVLKRGHIPIHSFIHSFSPISEVQNRNPNASIGWLPTSYQFTQSNQTSMFIQIWNCLQAYHKDHFRAEKCNSMSPPEISHATPFPFGGTFFNSRFNELGGFVLQPPTLVKWHSRVDS